MAGEVKLLTGLSTGSLRNKEIIHEFRIVKKPKICFDKQQLDLVFSFLSKKQMVFNPDSPLTGHPDNEDLLGRNKFCSQLAKQICLPPDSPGLVLSLEGSWGSGKTSAINRISHNLENIPDNERPIITHFNPWMVGSLNSLVQEFFLQITSSIGMSPHANQAKRISEALISYSRLFSFAKWIPGAEPYATVIESFLKGAGDATAATQELTSFNLAEQKKRISESIVELGKPFVIFIDDLDRLPPEEVFAMIRLVKAVSDFPQMAYVLAFDPAYIEKALVNFGIENGREYLDKIVQVRTTLPRIGLAQIGKIVGRELDSLNIDESLGTFSEEKQRLSDLYHNGIKFLFRTPRDVYRVFNRLSLIYPLTKTELGMADLLALESIAITAPKLYDHIYSNPQAYVGPLEVELAILKKPKEVVEQLKPQRKTVLSECPAVLQTFLSDLLSRLFPLTEEGWLVDEKHPPRTSGRIACPENLVIALSGGLPPSEVSLSQVRIFLEDTERRMAIVDEVGNIEQLGDFLDLVTQVIRENEVPDLEGFIEVLSHISKLEVTREIKRQSIADLLKRRVSLQIFWIIRKIFQSIDHENAKTHIQKIISSPDKLSLSVELLYFLCQQHGVFKEDQKEPQEDCLVQADELKKLLQTWSETTLKAFLSSAAFDSTEAGQAFYLLMRLNPEYTRQIVKKNIHPSALFDRLAKILWAGSWDSDKGSYAKFTESDLNELGEITEIRDKAKQRLQDDDLSPDLKAIYSSILSGEKQYFSDFETTP